MAGAPPHRGRVTAFDEAGGYGTVEDADGTPLFFHCTGLVDGRRTIDVGAEVFFLVAPGAPGQWQAVTLVKV